MNCLQVMPSSLPDSRAGHPAPQERRSQPRTAWETCRPFLSTPHIFVSAFPKTPAKRRTPDIFRDPEGSQGTDADSDIVKYKSQPRAVHENPGKAADTARQDRKDDLYDLHSHKKQHPRIAELPDKGLQGIYRAEASAPIPPYRECRTQKQPRQRNDMPDPLTVSFPAHKPFPLPCQTPLPKT